jgi:hypothetical protein
MFFSGSNSILIPSDQKVFRMARNYYPLCLSKPAGTLFSDNRRRVALSIISDIPHSGAGAEEGVQEGDGGDLKPARWVITSRFRGVMRVYMKPPGSEG